MFVLTKPIIHSMLFVVDNIVFIHKQTAIQNLVFSSSDAVDCYVYGVLARSMNVSEIIIIEGNAKYFVWNLSQCHLLTLRCTKNKRLQHVVFRRFLYATSDKTHNCTAKCIADLILYLRITSSHSIKKQGDYWGQSGQKKIVSHEAGNTIYRDLPYKINNK
jgi:UDP-glucose 4-epimerase